MATLYVSPTGSGLRDGSSTENAGTLANLNKYIQAAGAGGEVLLLADRGAYQQTTQLTITAGGAAGAPVTIRGIDSAGDPMAAEIVGSRAANWQPGMTAGNELFRLLSGANNLVFEDLLTRNFGNGVFRAGADISNLTIRDVDATNVTRFVENYVSGTATSASMDGLTIQDVTVTGFSRGAIRLQYDTRNVVIDRVIGDSQRQDGGLYVFGVSLDGTVHDVVISNTEMRNNFGSGGTTEYWNGDGFTTERGVYNVRFENTIASGNSDAGYDLKSSNTTLVGAVAEANKRNYRFWSTSISLEDSTSLSPVKYGGSGGSAHVWLALNAEAAVDNLAFSDEGTAKVLFDLSEGGATLHLSDTVIPPLYQSLVLVKNGSTIEYLEANAAPTGLSMTGGTVEENALAGTWVASLSADDPDAGDSHSFTLVGGATSLFEIAGSGIRVKAGAALDFEAQPTHGLTVRVTDQGGLSCDRTVTIGVTDVAETGTAGNDLLTGGAGDDRLAGGGGNDTYIVNSPGDVVVEALNQGIDLVKTTLAAYALGANVESLTYVGAGSFAGTGNGLGNLLTAGDGRDTLRGGGGNDTMLGGAGDDLGYGDSGNDQIRAGDGADEMHGGGGKDRIYGDAGDDSLFGEDGDDYLAGSLGNDLLHGGYGNDTMAGGAGDDTYVVGSAGDVVVEQADQGTDTVRSAVTHTLRAYVENLVLSGTAAANGTGNSGHNAITGNIAANVLSGGGGNDTLHGGGGSDTLIGGQGADTYMLGRGGGWSLISNADTDLGADRLVFGAGVAAEDLWFARSGEDLVVSLLGGGDRATLQGWYADAANQLDYFALSDGSTLAAAQVEQLVEAMSSFSAPPASFADLTSTQQSSVETVIAASWRSAG